MIDSHGAKQQHSRKKQGALRSLRLLRGNVRCSQTILSSCNEYTRTVLPRRLSDFAQGAGTFIFEDAT